VRGRRVRLELGRASPLGDQDAAGAFSTTGGAVRRRRR
jgi:hypothetical protein